MGGGAHNSTIQPSTCGGWAQQQPKYMWGVGLTTESICGGWGSQQQPKYMWGVGLTTESICGGWGSQQQPKYMWGVGLTTAQYSLVYVGSGAHRAYAAESKHDLKALCAS